MGSIFLCIILTIALSPKCSICIVQCPFPGLPFNGTALSMKTGYEIVWGKSTAFDEGEQIKYKCNNGWRIPSLQTSEITCQSSGIWSGPAPRCDQMVDLSKWEVKCKSSSFSNMFSKVNPFECSSKYYRSLKMEPTGMMFDIADVTIHFCPDSQPVVNVTLVSNENAEYACQPLTSNASAKTFQCQKDANSYRRVSSVEIKSDSDFALENVEISAKTGDQCGFPPSPINGRLKVNSSPLLIAYYECNDGYKLEGLPVSFCNYSDGMWVQSMPTCSEISNQWPIMLAAAIGAAVFGLLLIFLVVKAVFYFKSRQSSTNPDKKRPNIEENIYEEIDSKSTTVSIRKPRNNLAPLPPTVYPDSIIYEMAS